MGVFFLGFVITCYISAAVILLNFIVKKPRLQMVLLFATAILSMIIAWLNASSQPSNYIAEQIISWAFGAVAVLSVIFHLIYKNEKSYNIARTLASLSLAVGIAYMFFN